MIETDETDWRSTDKRLSVLAIAIVVVAIVLVCLGETEVLPTGIVPVSYALQATECLLALACMPLALKWMAIKWIRERVAARPHLYFAHSVVRLLMLAVPMSFGIALYFLMNDASMGYCASIAALALVYIWPSEKRRVCEMAIIEEQDEA